MKQNDSLADGARLRTPAEDFTTRVTAVEVPSELDPPLGPEDVVIIGTKTQAVAAILDTLSRAVAGAGQEPAIVCLTNGLHTEVAALRYFPRVYGMLVQLGGTHLVPGEVRCFSSGLHGWLDVGCFPSGTDELCEAIASAFRKAEFACEASADVMVLKRTKLLSNVSNGMAVIETSTAAGVAAAKKITPALRTEAEAVYDAAGLAWLDREVRESRPLPPPPSSIAPGTVTVIACLQPVLASATCTSIMLTVFSFVRSFVPSFFLQAWTAMRKSRSDCQRIVSGTIAGDESLRGGSSTWQSLTRGTGDIECDFLNGEIALLGRLFGVPTPANSFV